MLKPIPELVAEIRDRHRCITIEQAQSEIGKNHGIMVDVREPNEVADSPIPQSIAIPRGVLEMKLSEQYPDADTPLYIHCATGARATLSAEQLRRMGYQQISVVTSNLEQIRNCLQC